MGRRKTNPSKLNTLEKWGLAYINSSLQKSVRKIGRHLRDLRSNLSRGINYDPNKIKILGFQLHTFQRAYQNAKKIKRAPELGTQADIAMAGLVEKFAEGYSSERFKWFVDKSWEEAFAKPYLGIGGV